MNAWGEKLVSQTVAKKSSIMPLDAVDGDETYSSRRPSMAFSIVISSAYSMSLPTGMPMAMRVIFIPGRFSWPDK